ncbi:Adenylate cyclase (ATP pyrophosphate-lyase) (Adenylyl cyclase) (Crisp-1) [Durusdinium trenchii]|uniref:Adenylate cyclase (ATP pyrophosphate-lyase) (Adenylyl cyclase) (Crisp-1) n=1 Tax=Durusdinium trenchii TaxID=1381693 RepID=A0ABP0RSN6_9DINO
MTKTHSVADVFRCRTDISKWHGSSELSLNVRSPVRKLLASQKPYRGTDDEHSPPSVSACSNYSSETARSRRRAMPSPIAKLILMKGNRRIGLEQFDAALELIAKQKNTTLEDVWSHVRCCGGPVLTSTKAETVRFYDDKSTYTGTHKEGGPDPGRKGRGTLSTWSSTSPTSSTVPNSPRDPFETVMSLPALGSTMSTILDSDKRIAGRAGSLSEKKIAQQLRGKDGTVEDTFRAYCANKPDLDGKSFVKLCKDCEIVDNIFTQIDVDLVFAKVVTKGHRRITLHQFEVALGMIAQKKGVDEDYIFRRVAESEGVLHAGTQADYVRFFDDKSTYTGTHLYGGPDSTTRSSFDQLWSSGLRPDEEDRLPDMVVTKIAEISPTGAGTRPERPVSQKAPPRQRLAITAKSKPPQGKTDDFTMVFTDVQGSTSLWEANPRAMELALRLHDATIRQVLAKHSGYEVTTEGDAFQIAFHDTCDAVAFCLDTQAELLRCDWPAATLSHPDAAAASDDAWRGLRVRMGLHSGRPASVTKHEVTGRWRYAGPSVAMAKAIEGVCHGGQIILSASSFYLIDGLLTVLGSPQVVDLGEHILEGHGLTEDASRTGCAGRAKVQLIQLVAHEQAHAYSCEDSADASTFTGGRVFPPIDSEQQILPGFVESPAGPSITLCFVFTQGARELVATDPMLASQSLGLLRGYLREVLRNAGDGSGYECQEDEGAFMLAFANMVDAAVFSILLQRKLPHLPWPDGLKQRGPTTARGLRVSIGALSGGYTSRRPHASTGRADYFGTIVNRTARIAAAAHPGQVLLGGDTPIDPSATGRLPGLQWQQPPKLPGYPQMIPQPTPGVQPTPVQQQNLGNMGWSLQRLGAYALKGIDSPIVLTELRLFDEGGNFESFPEPKTKGRVSA